MTIKHIVLSGGGPTLFQTLGILKKLNESLFWEISNIESIYGTSAGSIIAILLALNFEWQVLLDYFLDRPWHEAYDVTANHIFSAYNNKGLFNKDAFIKAFLPLFKAKDIPITINLHEFYELTGKHLVFYTFELNQFETIELSHSSHPDLELMDAVHMSSALPIIFSPRCIDGKCYLDGGMFDNYPINYCVKRVEDTNQILGIHIMSEEESGDITKNISETSTIIDYTSVMLSKIIKHMNNSNTTIHIPYQIKCYGQKITMEYLRSTLHSKENRYTLYQKGCKEGIQFLSSLQEDSS